MHQGRLPDINDVPWDDLAHEAERLLRELFPLCRSITGNGVRETLRILNAVAPFDVAEVPSGTACWDWEVPREWNIRDAYIADASGRRVVDFRDNNLHVVGYSLPVDRELSFAELDEHLHHMEDMPEAIPYRTSYYKDDWGFCLSHVQYAALDRSARYRVVIDSSLEPGGLTYGQRLLPGVSGREYLVSTYCCHPSMANDNLSGLVLWILLLRILASARTRNAYRFVVVPETIGAIAYLKRNEAAMRRVCGGFLATTTGGPGPLGYKKTFLGGHEIDCASALAFRELGLAYQEYSFDIHGSDETNYSAPHFRIPVGTICKDKYYEYPQYHTSLDDLDFIDPAGLVETLKVHLLAIQKLENNRFYRSLHPYCEPMLSKRGLYPTLGGNIADKTDGTDRMDPAHATTTAPAASEIDRILWLMFQGDGQHSLLEISEQTGIPMVQLQDTAQRLVDHGLLREVVPDQD